LTLGRFVEDEWLPARQDKIRPTTFTSHERTLAIHVLPRLGGVRLQRLEPEHLNRLYAELREAGRLSPTSVRYVHVVLHKVLADAMRWGKVLRNVSDSVEPPRVTTTQRAEMATWTAPQLRQFLEHVRCDRLEAAWVLAATTGMRRGEVIGLRWSDVDLDRRELIVRQTVVCIGNRAHLSTPKTAKSARVVDLDPMTGGVLRAHRARQAEERLGWGPAYSDTGLVFCRENGEMLTPAYVTRRFQVLSRQAELPRIRLHDLRHTYATLSLQAGVRAEVVSRRLGHSRIAMTLDSYTHAVPALQREEAERVAALIFGNEIAVDSAR